MSSQQKRGFRLPWGADNAPDGSVAGAATLDPETTDPTSGVGSDDLGEGPFRLAGASPTPTMDGAPASSDEPEDTAEAAMIDTQAQTKSPTEPGNGTWPDTDRRNAPSHADDADRAAARPAVHVAGAAPRPGRRDNPLVAGLVKAMREAAISSRDETLTRLQADAGTRVESIRTRATTESAELRKRAEDDIAGIREWSKAEIARVRQQTEDRIEARRAELSGETDRHATSVERLVSDVQSIVETFKTDMEGFFEQLLKEDDPARLAALAEQVPDAPDLSGDGPAAIDMVSDAAPARASLEADDAAAAEVAATEGLDMGAGQDWPAAVLAASQRDDPATDDGATRLLVSGLGSVAGISALKGALGQLPGVHAVSVSSGEHGEFVFAINHDPGVDLATGITGLPGFAARITDATDDGITVVAHEPEAA
jgi:hypothetical protein